VKGSEKCNMNLNTNRELSNVKCVNLITNAIVNLNWKANSH